MHTVVRQNLLVWLALAVAVLVATAAALALARLDLGPVLQLGAGLARDTFTWGS